MKIVWEKMNKRSYEIKPILILLCFSLSMSQLLLCEELINSHFMPFIFPFLLSKCQCRHITVQSFHL